MDPLHTAIAVAALVVLTLAISLALRLESPWLQPWAIVRAVVQLGLLSLVLSGVIADARWVAVFLTVMVLAAAWTVRARLRRGILSIVPIAGIIALAAAVPVGVVFAAGGLEFSPRYVLALGGIIVGNTMTIATLMGRGFGTSLIERRDEVEGWLALGATPRRAASDLVRAAASTSLIPSTDQAKTTGVVVLPGAFVGAIFAGAAPLEAAQFQLLVLAAILAAGALTVLGIGWMVGAPTTVPLPSTGSRHPFSG